MAAILMTSLLGPDAEPRWAKWDKLLHMTQSLFWYKSPKIVTKLHGMPIRHRLEWTYSAEVFFKDMFSNGQVGHQKNISKQHLLKPLAQVLNEIYRKVPHYVFLQNCTNQFSMLNKMTFKIINIIKYYYLLIANTTCT